MDIQSISPDVPLKFGYDLIGTSRERSERKADCWL